MKINTYIVKTINDMLSLDTIKLALLTGIPIMLIWIGIGWLLWDPVTSFTAQIISWIPFSIVRANGAFIITFFLWFILVLVSYALFIGLFSGFLLGGKKERRFEAINFSLIFIFSIFWAIVIMIKWPWLNQEIQRFLTILPFDTVAQGLSWLLAFYLFYNLFLISEYFVVFIFREPFIMGLLERHGIDLDLNQEISKAKTYGVLYWDILWFLIASVLILPVLFIPVANFLAIWFVWAWLYKESAFMGVCSLLCTQKDLEVLKEHKAYFVVTALTAALLNFIPIINIFTPFFVMALYFHWIIENKKS
ncbi:MAG: hypothetical protein C6H99_03040 [Epsilonproteobacteria bacterium]|nr:hypothetical protein [Campylobacterota bacterium]NPA63370.1 hypothetical protein [Campylobacterota bacterium]